VALGEGAGLLPLGRAVGDLHDALDAGFSSALDGRVAVAVETGVA